MTSSSPGIIHTTNSWKDTLTCATWHLNYPGIFTCWCRSLLVATSKFGLHTIRYHSATRKHQFLYHQGDRSGLTNPKKGYASTLIIATTYVHLPKSVSNDLTIKSDLILINPVGKMGWKEEWERSRSFTLTATWCMWITESW